MKAKINSNRLENISFAISTPILAALLLFIIRFESELIKIFADILNAASNSFLAANMPFILFLLICIKTFFIIVDVIEPLVHKHENWFYITKNKIIYRFIGFVGLILGFGCYLIFRDVIGNLMPYSAQEYFNIFFIALFMFGFDEMLKEFYNRRVS